MKLILENFREFITEKSRYEKETGKKSFAADEIKQYISDDDFPTHAFTMTSVEKVGLNPKTPNTPTPAGIYFYPLNTEYYDKLLNKKLDVVTNNRPYVGVVMLKETDKWLKIISKGTDYQSEEKVKEVAEKLNKSDYQAFHNTDATIYSLVKDFIKGEHSDRRRQTTAWNSLLRELGFVGAYDGGNGIIHNLQPSQLFALSSQAYETVGVYETSDVRRGAVPEIPVKERYHLAKTATSPEELETLANDDDKEVRWTAAKNPNVSLETLTTIASSDIAPWFAELVDEYEVADNILKAIVAASRQNSSLHNKEVVDKAVSKLISRAKNAKTPKDSSSLSRLVNLAGL